MDKMNRRDAVKAAGLAAGMIALGEGNSLAAEEKKRKESRDEEKVTTSGETATEPRTTVQKLDVSKVQVKALAGGLNTFFSRITPDPNPGRAVLTISGLPAGTRAISVWMTEWILPNNPHAGGAFFYTSSVQLYNNGTQCRVVYNLDWSDHLPAACQVIYGPA